MRRATNTVNFSHDLPLWPHLATSDALTTAQHHESADSDRITNVRECEDSCPPLRTGGSDSEHGQQQEERRINRPALRRSVSPRKL
jgi:hypothetical protein